MIWKQPFTIERLNQSGQGTMVAHLGIEFTESGEDFLRARMPVDDRTVQPMRILHGGASAVLAETIGSVASYLCLDEVDRRAAVGVEINANHLRSVREGFVYGEARPLRLGRRLHVWNIDIRDEAERLICVSRLTMAIIDRS